MTLKYVQITDNGERRLRSRPRWYVGEDGPSRQLTDEELSALGVYVVVDELPQYDPETEAVEETPLSDWTIEKGQVHKAYNVRPLTPEELEARYRATVPHSITPRQLLLGLARQGFITHGDLKQSEKTNEVPQAIQNVFSSLPADQEAEAYVTWKRMSVVLRDDPLVAVIASANSLTDKEVDDFFRQCSAIE